MTYYCIRESLPLGDMGDWLGLSFKTKSERDQVLLVWENTYSRQACVGKPVAFESKFQIGHLVSDVGYWVKRLS